MTKNITAALLTLIFATLGARADRLTLKTGSTLDGAWLGGSSRQIRMEINGQIQTFDVAQVQSITFTDSAPQPQPQPVRPQTQLAPRVSGVNTAPGPGNSSGPGVTIPSSTIPSDTPILIRMVDSVNSETARRGQTFQASLDEPIYVDGRQVVPRGADVLTKLVNDQKAGKLQGQTSLTLALSQISINGRYVDVTSTDVQTTAASQTNRTAKVVGGTAALGAIIGAIAGGGKAAAIGAGSGAALGGATQVFTNGPQVKIPSETRLTFRLQAPVQF